MRGATRYVTFLREGCELAPFSHIGYRSSPDFPDRDRYIRSKEKKIHDSR